MKNSQETIKTLMNQYTYLDSLNLIKSKKEIKIKLNSKNVKLLDDCVKKSLEQNLNKSQFEFFENEMLESIYKSTKNKSLGKCRQSNSSPENLTNVTFGIKSKTGCKLYDIIMPPVSPRRVLLNSQKGHKLYVKTHQHYNPSEKIKRPYCSDVFKSNQTFGKHYKVNWSGQLIKNTLNNNYYHNRVISTIQSELNNEKYDKRNLINENKIEKYDLNQEIAYLNSLRINLKKKRIIFKNLIQFVKNENLTTNHLTTTSGLINSLSKQQIFINLFKLTQILDKFEISQNNNQIKYIEFIKLLDIKTSFPKLNLQNETRSN